eukprot:COSAG02_NODE_45317_length_358_cov_0.841699_1_plen_66_part_10
MADLGNKLSILRVATHVAPDDCPTSLLRSLAEAHHDHEQASEAHQPAAQHMTAPLGHLLGEVIGRS